MAIGLNMHAMFSTAREKDEAIAYHRAVDVDATLIMDDPSFAVYMANLFPQTLIIYRRSGDNNAHLTDSPFYVSPQQWAANYLADIPRPHPRNLVIYYNNEGGASKTLNDHALACAKQVAPYPDVNVAWLNFAVGNPNFADWNLLEPFIRFISQRQYRQRFFLALHEYFLPDALYDWIGHQPDFRKWPTKLEGVGNLGGRWRAFDTWCASKGIDPCDILITENGYDLISAYYPYQQSLIHTPGHRMVGTPHANVAQWEAWIHQHGLNMSWQEYAAESLYRAWKLFYNTPRIKGVCLFCYGGEEGYDHNGDPKWRRGFDYSKSSMPLFLPHLEKKDWTPMATPTPQPTVPTHYINSNTTNGTNVRAAASTSVKVVRLLTAAGELARYVDSTVTADNKVWDKWTFMDGAIGWIRSDVYKKEALKPSVLLDVPYRSQEAPDAKKFVNDCEYAALAMMMESVGVSRTVDEIAVKGGMTADVPQPFTAGITAAKAYGFDAKAQQGMYLSDVLQSLNNGRPVACLVNYEHLRNSSAYRYGHFVVPIGYTQVGQALSIILHDPYNKASMAFPAAQFAKAIGEMTGTGNSAWQSLVITNWEAFEKPTDPPPPTPEGDSPVLFHVENLLREALTAIVELRANVSV